MRTKQFKAESKRLMDLMINSIYTHREIFLRELISNASDAIDKLYYKALKENLSDISRENFEIRLTADKDARTLTISDNGCGMSREDLENNLGTIAKSGSLAFKAENGEEAKDDIDIIGQFGVGFYSAFMVASCVKVVSREYGSDEAWRWESHGIEGYTIDPCEKESYGTEICLTIKENTDDDRYDDFLQFYRLRELVKKYSDYIRYPIRTDVERSRPKEGGEEGETESYIETETLNSMIPLWKKQKSEITEEDYNNFYKDKFFDYQPPAKVIHTSTEGSMTYNALLFLPSRPPFDYYTRDFEKGLQLYASGVMIMEKCADLLPDYFSFVRGLVDSQDLSLNISREMLQHNRQLVAIEKHLEKKIKNELESMLQNDRENYEKFFDNFGRQLKFGVYADYGMHKEVLQDLLLFTSSDEKKKTTLKEYAGRMREGQKYIYYACGENADRIARLPQIEMLCDNGYEVLYLTEDVDEFALTMMREYDGKEFKNASSDDIELDETDKENTKKLNEDNKDLLSFMKDALGDKVKEVTLSGRLKSHPVCLSSSGGMSIEMEKVLNAMPNDQKVKAERVLEINAGHAVFEKLKELYAADQDKVKAYTSILYSQALLIEGLPIEDPVEYSNQVCELMK